jgi:SH3 domain protein
VKSVVLAMALMLLSTSLYAETAYISDDLNVAIRSGKTFQHRIMRFVPSGTPVEVLQRDDDGYVLIRTPEGTEGWLEANHLSQQPHARDRLAQAQRQMAALRERVSEGEARISTLRTERDEALARVQETETTLERMATEMETLRETAARPMEIAEENERLRELAGRYRARAEALEVELEEARQAEQREWFVIGAGVALGSAILGIILTRIRWRRRTDGWA